MPGYKLSIHGGFCGLRVLFSRDIFTFTRFESSIPRASDSDQRESRKQVDHVGLWLLR